ncbi:Villin-2 [Camellia lanceoleosa]|uniref:Villin-2 n=1 Tax=Camellia lanceoleosa TaxID=1840588 RepID=A0ACC0F9A5_9ERIC|nr:Villin-2 [Camellia lanceoleosa]
MMKLSQMTSLSGASSLESCVSEEGRAAAGAAAVSFRGRLPSLLASYGRDFGKVSGGWISGALALPAAGSWKLIPEEGYATLRSRISPMGQIGVDQLKELHFSLCRLHLVHLPQRKSFCLCKVVEPKSRITESNRVALSQVLIAEKKRSPEASPVRSTTSPPPEASPSSETSQSTFSYEQLKAHSDDPVTGIDFKRREVWAYLSDEEFQCIGGDEEAFYKLPKWKQDMQKKKFDLF